MPDYLIGVSAGIAYGVSYLSGQKGRNIEVVENYIADKRYMGMRHLFNRNEKAYFNTKFVFEEVPNELIPFDYDAFAAYPGKVEAAVTNIHTEKPEYVEVRGDGTCAIRWWRAVRADSFPASEAWQTLLSGRRDCRFHPV